MAETQEEEQGYNNAIAKAKKNLIYFGIFGIVMFFAGLSSAYIVLLGDTFWVSFRWPVEFWISTVILIASSATIALALKAAKSDNKKALKLHLGITLFLGLMFTFFQVKGYQKLTEGGNYFVSNIIVVEGKYDDYFYYTYQDEKIEFDGYDYTINGEKISEEQLKDIQDLSGEIFQFLRGKQSSIPDTYGKEYMIFYENQPVTFSNDKFSIGDSLIGRDDRIRMEYFVMNLNKGFGDFYIKGRYGEDFELNYRGIQLEYKDRQLQSEGKKLSVGLMNKLVDTRNLASTFLYMLSALHILHLLGGLIYLIVLFRKSLNNSINSNNIVGLKNGAIYWHFLDLLWIYLILFLNFIH
ncbi:MAG: cytochrome c oxidase subunit 3 [Crocinitomicaceae bacterium]|nr:cytochrome c oxidase subunit 3 [Crocinitomicaceae bacterium]